jgi:hypothetical protein
LLEIRKLVSILANKISEVLPEFTDHSVKHLDSLWQLTEQILNEEELQKITPSEAFVLGCSYYLHDLGMAVGATAEGAEELRKTDSYSSTLKKLKGLNISEQEADTNALKIAARQEHANLAIQLATKQLPGLNRYLIEDSDVRLHWGETIGNVAASHHWPLTEMDRNFGCDQRKPDPIHGTFDLGFVACILRIVDYSHINFDRASILERALRRNMPDESGWHWLAQACITGPMRDHNKLRYSSTKAFDNVEAWFKFYELASGLNEEIHAVNDYLSRRTASCNRFSLEGVLGAQNPTAFAAHVKTKGFEPVDIRFHPNTIERLVAMLGGQTLYGNDYYAPIRELLQNARDAVELYQSGAEANTAFVEPPKIVLQLRKLDSAWRLIVSDNGVGMTHHVITNYLLGIASNYWTSPEFHVDHPKADQARFQPVGQFGIGFLSVFMLGSDVEIKTQRRTGSTFRIKLQGVGNRGALVNDGVQEVNGTTITVTLSDQVAADLVELNRIVKAKAPMLSIPIEVIQEGESSKIEPGWWKTVNQDDLVKFVAHQHDNSSTPLRLHNSDSDYKSRRFFAASYDLMRTFEDHGISLSVLKTYDKWPGKQPELVTNTCRILAVPGLNYVLLCSKGFAVAPLRVPGLFGIVNQDNLQLNVSRSQPIGLDHERLRNDWLKALRPRIISALDALAGEGDVTARLAFLAQVASVYGRDCLLDTSLSWVSMKGPSGDTHQVSVATLKERLQSSGEVLLAYNVSLWSIGRRVREIFIDAHQSALVIPVSSAGNQPEPDVYGKNDQEKTGPLNIHFKERAHHGSQVESATLLLATLDAIAGAWNLTTEALIGDNWVLDGKALFVHLRKSQRLAVREGL